MNLTIIRIPNQGRFIWLRLSASEYVKKIFFQIYRTNFSYKVTVKETYKHGNSKNSSIYLLRRQRQIKLRVSSKQFFKIT